MGQRKAAKGSRAVSVKRLPSDTKPAQSPRKRPNRSLSQQPSPTPSSVNRNAPPAKPTPTAPTPSKQRVSSLQENSGIGVRVPTATATATLPQPTPASTPSLANRRAFMNAELIMKAQTIQIGVNRASGFQPYPLPGTGDGGTPLVPVNSGGSANLPLSRITPWRPLPYTTQNGHKIPTRDFTTSATGAYSPRPRNTILVTSRSQLPTQRRSINPTEQAGVRPKPTSTKFHRNRRRPVVVDDEDDSDDEEVLVQRPTTSQQPTRKRARSPVLSPSPQRSVQRASERIVPPELWSVRSAVGDENWQTYVGLTESLINGEITQRDFEIMTGRIFQMGDKKMVKLVQKMTYKMLEETDT